MDIKQTEQYIRSASRTKVFMRRLKAILPIFSLFVILGIFWWLKLTGITMAGEAFCGISEHVHTEECGQKILVCMESEPSQPQQTTAITEYTESTEFTNTTEETVALHTHTEECYQVTYTCGQQDHTHIASCYSDLSADVETETDWDVFRQSGTNMGERVLAVAMSQLEYTESTLNFQVDTQGVRRGITRYGQWYGNPYGDWSTMFTAFCLHYGGFDKVSPMGGAETMLLSWQEADLYWPAMEYLAQPGDVAFLDLNGNGTADTTAIVTQVSDGIVYVIQGDLENQVREAAYMLSQGQVLGFGMVETDFSIAMMANPGSVRLGTTVNYSDNLLRGGTFALYTTGSDGNTYAIDGYGNAVPVHVSDAGVVTTDLADTNTLFWTFTHCGTYDNRTSYYIQNVSTGWYLHPFYNSATDNASTLADRWESAIYPNGTGMRVRGARQNAYAMLSENSFFRVSQNLNGGSTLYLVKAPEKAVLWFDGTLGGIQSLGGALNRSYTVTEGEVITLPAEWQGPDKYSNTLRGWYDLVNHQYYKPGAEYTVTGNTVFYADWVATSYDIGQFNAQVADTVSTNHLITTRMFDYNMLFNLQSASPQVTVSESGHSETWSLVTSGTVPYQNQQTLNYIMRDWDSGGMISYPNNTNNANTYVDGNIHTNLYRQELAEILFNTDNAFDPSDGSGIIGKTYLGTGDHLFQFADDPDHAYYGYYYYDSQYNAVSYNQSAQRFYVYDYLSKTSSSPEGKYSDFLPLNSPYTNTNGKSIVTYTYDGIDGEYKGVNHFQYDNSYDNTTTAGSNLWFGMSMEMRFYLPDVPGTRDADGQYGNLDMYGKQMHYHFSGDDDVWVFVDGVLVLDIGGIHGIQGGDINFSTGVAKVDNGGTTDISWLQPGEHVLTMYYLERGGSESNCAMYFNISPRFSLDIQKEDVLTQELLNGTEFSVYTDYECTVPAQLWTSEQAHNEGKPSTNVFTVENGIASMWGLGSGKTYYIKETGPPNSDGYDLALGVIRLTVDKQGFATYDVSVIPEADGTPPSNGYTVHDVSIDQDLQKMKITVTNAQNWVQETTTVQVYKEWTDGKAHTDDYVGVYLIITDPDGTVRRIRQVYLAEENGWSYTWTNLPKYYSDQVTKVEYGIEESYFPGYYPTIERITKLVITEITWAEAYAFGTGEKYLLKTSSGCLATTSATNQTLQWMDEATAKESPLALWTATVSGSNIRLVNGAGQILSYKNGNTNANRYIYATTGSASSQNFISEQSANGLKLYCQYNNRKYYFASIGANGNASTNTNASRGVVFTPMTQSVKYSETEIDDWGYKLTNTALEEETYLTVTKNWVYNMGGPELFEQMQVTIKLLANGAEAGRTVTLSLKNNWTATFTGLPYRDSEGNVIRYTVEESWNTPDWKVTYGPVITVDGDPPGYETTVTNTYRWGNGIELPATGGYGRTPWVLSAMGIFLVTLVLGCVLRRERKGGKRNTS